MQRTVSLNEVGHLVKKHNNLNSANTIRTALCEGTVGAA